MPIRHWISRVSALFAGRIEPPPAPASRDGVHVDKLAPLTRLLVRTRNTMYDITVVSPDDGEVIIRGGRLFRQPIRGRVTASSLDGTLREARAIVVGMVVELHSDCQRFQTTRVESIASVSPAGLG